MWISKYTHRHIHSSVFCSGSLCGALAGLELRAPPASAGIPVGYQSGPALAGAFSVTPAHTEFGLSSFLSTGPSSPTRSLGEGLSSGEPCNCAEAQGSKATLENEDKINSLPDLRSLGPEGLNT